MLCNSNAGIIYSSSLWWGCSSSHAVFLAALGFPNICRDSLNNSIICFEWVSLTTLSASHTINPGSVEHVFAASRLIALTISTIYKGCTLMTKELSPTFRPECSFAETVETNDTIVTTLHPLHSVHASTVNYPPQM